MLNEGNLLQVEKSRIEGLLKTIVVQGEVKRREIFVVLL